MTQLLIGLFYTILVAGFIFITVLTVKTFKEGKKVQAVIMTMATAFLLVMAVLTQVQPVLVMGQKVGGDYKTSNVTNVETLSDIENRKQCALFDKNVSAPTTEQGKYWERRCDNLDKLNLPEVTQAEKVAYESERLEEQIGYCEENESGKNESYDKADADYKKESEELCTEFRKQFETVQATGVTEW
jgi:hypothetical protein